MRKMNSKTKSQTKKQVKQTKAKKTPRTRKPKDMSLPEWQRALRREFGREQNFELKNIGEDPIFSEFFVSNPESERTYRVAIRGNQAGDNFCSCPDFAVNLLGTCKHIEFTLAKLERKRGAKKRFREGFIPPYSEIYLRYGTRREVCFKAGTECPEELRKYVTKFFDQEGALKPNAYLRFHTFMKNAPKNGHELRCYEDVLQYIAQLRDDHHREKLINQKFRQGVSSPTFKKLLKTHLYPYQRIGALFAAKAGRCLIGDDMGLGKTIQAIAAAEILAQTVGIERVLIICPTSLKHQWRQEIEKFTDRSFEVVEGPMTRRKEAYHNDAFYKITNYEVIHRDMEEISQWSPDLIILDEAQRIKNWNTRRAQSVKRLDSKYAFVLTGTPLENRLEELHSIVEFIDRYRLGPLYRFLAEHQHVDEVGKVVGYKNLSTIAQSLEPILIRRTKDEVLKELPKRIDKHYFVPMTKEQRDCHESNRETVAKLVYKWRKFGFLSEQDQRRLMVALQFMRMSCNSTFLIDKQTDYGTKADEVVQLFDEIMENPHAKIVVFSQWIATHQLIIDRLNSRPWKYAFFHGSLSSQERGKLIHAFNNDPECRVFFSTDAGGVGLNLQKASVVINMDQPWNPAVLDQRIGRVHRLGQERSVQVFHFVSQGTIEHGMLDVLRFKKSVFSGVLDGGESEVFLGGTKLKKFMDTVDQVSQKIPDAGPSQEDQYLDGNEIVKEGEEQIETSTAKRPRSQEQDPWVELVSTGVDFINQLGETLQSSGDGQKTKPQYNQYIEKDEKTGETHLKIPMPDQKTLETITTALKPLLEAFQDRFQK